ncbi:MAG: hypothetical protein LC803_22960 [Acidobacteria bacterium]|nr:hypothetical protein [Acidobacteriota bacterium]
MTTLEALNIALSVVSLIITALGFIAAFGFYREGLKSQKAANDAMLKIEEKAQIIQNQIDKMFDKTLDAALGTKYQLAETLDQSVQRFDEIGKGIADAIIKHVGIDSESERTRVTQIVREQVSPLKEQIETARESAEEIAYELSAPVTNETDRAVTSQILTLLQKARHPLPQQEILKSVKVEKAPTDMRPVTNIIRLNLMRLKNLGMIKTILGEDNETLFAHKDYGAT